MEKGEVKEDPVPPDVWGADEYEIMGPGAGETFIPLGDPRNR